MNTHPMLTTFLALLNIADALTVDDSPILTNFTAEELLGDPDNQIVRFTWTDGEYDYADVLTEGGIADGIFDSNGNFVCQNSEGETSRIRFFKLEPLGAHSVQPSPPTT